MRPVTPRPIMLVENAIRAADLYVTPCLRGEDRQPRPRRSRGAARLDHPAAEHALAAVDHERLAGRDRAHRLIERELDLILLHAHDLRPRWRSVVSHLHLHLSADLRRLR